MSLQTIYQPNQKLFESRLMPEKIEFKLKLYLEQRNLRLKAKTSGATLIDPDFCWSKT
jgi:hypothetical protein